MKVQTTSFTEDARVQKLLARLKKRKGKKFSDIIDDDGHQYVDLVMEGGGVLGIALVGYTYALEEAGIRFLGVGGTSAGAINALLVAGLNPPAERKSLKLIDLLANMDMNSFVDGNQDAKNPCDVLPCRPPCSAAIRLAASASTSRSLSASQQFDSPGAARTGNL